MQYFDFDTVSKLRRSQPAKGYFRDKLVQSLCWDGRRFYVGFSWMNNPNMSTIARLKDLSFTDRSIEMFTNIELGHCNDMEYINNRIYVATGNKNIYVVNPKTLDISEHRTMPHDVWDISAYPDGNWFTFDGTTARRYSKDFMKSSVISTSFNTRIRQVAGDGYWQGSFIVDNIPYLIYMEKDTQADHYKACYLCSENEVYKCYKDCEVEGGCKINDELDFVYGQLWMGGLTWDMNTSTKTIYVPLDVEIASGNTEINLSKSVPDGYKLSSANVSFKKGSSWRSLPYVNTAGKIALQILKVSGKKVYLKSLEDFGTVPIQITAFCYRTT